MFKIIKKEINWAGRRLVLESGRFARQADGAVLVSYGETTVLCTAVALKKANCNVDFFPLTVVYQEKFYAGGKFPGGFMKREGKPSERETLISRLIDRPIRPLFHEDFRNEAQVVCTVLSYDGKNEGDIAAIIGASAALTISGIPFLGPIAAAKVGYIKNSFVLNPVASDMNCSQLDLTVAGTSEGVLMVESEAQELSEDIMLAAVEFGHKSFQPIVDMIVSFAEECAKSPWEIPRVGDQVLIESGLKNVRKDLEDAYREPDKLSRRNKVAEVKNKLIEYFVDAEAPSCAASQAFCKLEKDIVRSRILDTGLRLDGRNTGTIRPIVVQVGVLPQVHGSALFTRGNTQALVITTLGVGENEQVVDDLVNDYKEHFLLHYNFPPFSVGEVGRMGAPGRREIGHGKLAWRALHPIMPRKDKFPYTVRIVSEITESDGSSSMATVCGSSLSLMDAGVPLPKPVAGIAMGLIKEEERYCILSDIMGDEDHLGDMDFKVAGTADGVTALQMDIKITSITIDIIRKALAQAKEGRFHILGEMSKALSISRQDVNENAPRIEIVKINPSKIGELIGPGGKMIREITETTGAKIDIEEDGTVKVSACDKSSIDAALSRVKIIGCDLQVGDLYTGKIVKIMDFGVFVNIGGRDGMVHVSELANRRVENPSDIVNLGDVVTVRVMGYDNKGRLKLSIKAVSQSE
ncbi:MAG: polyribonucleotide nucleotidyltransferase [Holosporales bacterium]|jgi:polyribonucleotide nucleotidyltransferase|nr:polyribonucleotide nucleotidyltransferase [Holosporales bacterium]